MMHSRQIIFSTLWYVETVFPSLWYGNRAANLTRFRADALTIVMPGLVNNYSLCHAKYFVVLVIPAPFRS